MGKGDAFGLAIAALESEDLDILPVEDVGEDLVWFEEVSRRFEAERSRRIGVFEEREGHDVHGYPSVVAFLKDRSRMSGARAKHLVSVARAARRFKATFLSWKHGQISTDQAEMLFRVSERLPDKFPDAEPVLLEIVGDTPEETRRILDYWRHTVDQPGIVVDSAVQMQRRHFDYTRKANGMIEGDFALTETAGEALFTAFDALMPPPDADDDRTPSQRRHDGFEDLTRSFLEGSETPVVGGERPHINVHVDLPALKGTPGGLHETEDGHVLSVETVRQLVCDASVTRVVFGPKSELLDVGRKTRVIPAGLRRAVIARDRRCGRKGCNRKPRWCDIHHIVSWADGGETCLENLCLLCRYHHTLAHRHEGENAEFLNGPMFQPEVVHRPM